MGNTVYDRAGFPLVRVEGTGFWMHALPVTKMQYELFICDQPSKDYQAAWYEGLTADHMNPRVSPDAVEPNNYWRLFMTGLTPSEALSYARWCGPNFDLPTQAEWSVAFQSLQRLGDEAPIIEPNDNGLKGLAFRKLHMMAKQAFTVEGKKYTAADGFLMRFGVMEWVKDMEGGVVCWRAMGYPDPLFYRVGQPLNYLSPVTPANPDARMKAFGFRLIKRQLNSAE